MYILYIQKWLYMDLSGRMPLDTRSPLAIWVQMIPSCEAIADATSWENLGANGSLAVPPGLEQVLI